MLYDYTLFVSQWQKDNGQYSEISKVTQICDATTVQKGLVVSNDNFLATINTLFQLKKEYLQSELILIIPENRMFVKTVGYDKNQLELSQQQALFISEVPYDPAETITKTIVHGERAQIIVVPIGAYLKVKDTLVKAGNKVDNVYSLSSLIIKKYNSPSKDLYIYKFQSLVTFLLTENGVILYTQTHLYPLKFDYNDLKQKVEQFKALPISQGVVSTVYLINAAESDIEKAWIDPFEIAAQVILEEKIAKEDNLTENYQISQAVLEKNVRTL